MLIASGAAPRLGRIVPTLGYPITGWGAGLGVTFLAEAAPEPMPRISEFYGIAIYLYFGESGTHNAPHFHARHGDDEAVFSIPDAEILAGTLPRRQFRLVQAWAELRTDELEQAWGRAVNNEQPGTIEPLR